MKTPSKLPSSALAQEVRMRCSYLITLRASDPARKAFPLQLEGMCAAVNPVSTVTCWDSADPKPHYTCQSSLRAVDKPFEDVLVSMSESVCSSAFKCMFGGTDNKIIRPWRELCLFHILTVAALQHHLANLCRSYI